VLHEPLGACFARLADRSVLEFIVENRRKMSVTSGDIGEPVTTLSKREKLGRTDRWKLSGIAKAIRLQALRSSIR
jgi:hypothetical protein